MIGKTAVIHHLQEQIENIRMRLFNLIEQQDGMRCLIDSIGEQTTLIKADITRRKAYRSGVTLNAVPYIRTYQNGSA